MEKPRLVCVWLVPGEQYAPYLSYDHRPFMAARWCARFWGGVCSGVIEVRDMSGALVGRWQASSDCRLRKM